MSATVIKRVPTMIDIAQQLHQDCLMTVSMGGVLPEQRQLSSVHRVLDIACGTGRWANDVACHYPHMQVYGIDTCEAAIQCAQVLAWSESRQNTTFDVMDMHGPLHFPGHFFDLLNARSIAQEMTACSWEHLLKESLRLLRPGGTLRLTEQLTLLTNSPACQRLYDVLVQLRVLTGRGMRFSDVTQPSDVLALPHLLRACAYQHVRLRMHLVECSFGTPLHEGWVETIIALSHLCAPQVAATTIMSSEEWHALCCEAVADMRSECFHGVASFLTVWGITPKPL